MDIARPEFKERKRRRQIVMVAIIVVVVVAGSVELYGRTP
jgi:beta-lactamase regulating signal transducer with metallopeptidase domain